MQSGFVFLVRSDDQWSEIPYYVRCTLAEKAYSFLEIISQKTNRNPPRIQSGEKLFLIRTAEYLVMMVSPRRIYYPITIFKSFISMSSTDSEQITDEALASSISDDRPTFFRIL